MLAMYSVGGLHLPKMRLLILKLYKNFLDKMFSTDDDFH